MLHVTFRQLSVFESVARNLSFSRAAEEMHLTQPAVSMQIKQLEENVGQSLFEQMGKKIYLTEAGRELYHYSKVIAQQLMEAKSVLSELKGLERGKLNISVVSTANYFAPQLLAEFCAKYPQIKVSLTVGNRESVLKQLHDNEIDLAILGTPPEGIDAEAHPFMENRLVIISASSNPLAGEHHIPASRFRNEVFIMREQGSGTRLAAEKYFSSHRVEVRTGMEMSTNEAVKQAVQAGMGLGILSMDTVLLEVETGRLNILDAEGFPIIRHWYVVHRQKKRLSNVAKAFKSFLLSKK
ncbi:MAG TPA: LysR substrate-binding domain-containing protein [Burkholderiales bacterium]|nr:LysR substrate-binding domain-containing protein [Burkholderiales bacterium]